MGFASEGCKQVKSDREVTSAEVTLEGAMVNRLSLLTAIDKYDWEEEEAITGQFNRWTLPYT